MITLSCLKSFSLSYVPFLPRSTWVVTFLKPRTVLFICSRAPSPFQEQGSGLINTWQFSDGGRQDQIGVKPMTWKRFQPQISWKKGSGSDGEISYQPSISNGGWNVILLICWCIRGQSFLFYLVSLYLAHGGQPFWQVVSSPCWRQSIRGWWLLVRDAVDCPLTSL